LPQELGERPFELQLVIGKQMQVRTAMMTLGVVLLASTGSVKSADGTTVTMLSLDQEPVGEVKLTDTPSGVLLQGRIQGLDAGPHAIHLHAVGRCDPPFDSAGSHFNPVVKVHGYLNEGGPHAGDLPNVHVPESGILEFEILAANVTLRAGKSNPLLDQDGAALVIHAGPDDYKTDPSGASGSRLACGVIR
jgi:superoxide dismutase, Cu-Zn family